MKNLDLDKKKKYKWKWEEKEGSTTRGTSDIEEKKNIAEKKKPAGSNSDVKPRGYTPGTNKGSDIKGDVKGDVKGDIKGQESYINLVTKKAKERAKRLENKKNKEKRIIPHRSYDPVIEKVLPLKKGGKRFTFTISPILYNLLKKYSMKFKIPMSFLINFFLLDRLKDEIKE